MLAIIVTSCCRFLLPLVVSLKSLKPLLDIKNSDTSSIRRNTTIASANRTKNHHLKPAKAHTWLEDNVTTGHCYIVIVPCYRYRHRSSTSSWLVVAAVPVRTLINFDTSNLNPVTNTATPSDLHVKADGTFNIRACCSCRRTQCLQRGASGCGFFYVLVTFVSNVSP